MLSKVTHGRPRTPEDGTDPGGEQGLRSPDDDTGAAREAPTPATTGAAAGQTTVATAAKRPLTLPDVTAYELAAWTPLVVLILLFGLWPKALLLLTTPAVQAIVQGVSP
jgi:NADH-quinone oxidoreductase subunit M